MLLKIRTCIFSLCIFLSHPLAAQISLQQDSLQEALKASPAFTIFEDNYFTTGIIPNREINKDNADAKFQISFKQRLTNQVLPFRTYLYVTYIQKSFWHIYKSSSPFSETNYNPALGIGKLVFNKSRKLHGVAFLQFEHESNGFANDSSESWDFISGSYTAILNSKARVGIEAWLPLNDNTRIVNYIGYGEVNLNWIVIKDKLLFDAEVRKAPRINRRGSIQLGLSYRPISSGNQFLYLQWWYGYGESLLTYNEVTNKIRIGIVFKPTGFIFY